MIASAHLDDSVIGADLDLSPARLQRMLGYSLAGYLVSESGNMPLQLHRTGRIKHFVHAVTQMVQSLRENLHRPLQFTHGSVYPLPPLVLVQSRHLPRSVQI